MKRIGLLLIAILVAAVASFSAADAAPPVKQWLEGQLAAEVANEARTVRLQKRQEAVVSSTHDVIQAQMPALNRIADGAGEEAAVDAVQEALHAQAKVIHVKTQRTMTKVLQMLRRQINETERMLNDG